MPRTASTFVNGHPHYPKQRTREERRAYRAALALRQYHAQTPEERAHVREGEQRRWRTTERFKAHGITRQDYLNMLDRQEGNCAFCHRPLPLDNEHVRSQIAIDHDHKTGRVRGLLHMTCNSVVGHAEKDDRFLKYLGLIPEGGHEDR